MSAAKLHLDMDTSRKDLLKALLDAGFDVTRTPNSEINGNATDESQLVWATTHQRIIFTFNVRDFIFLAQKYPYHGGILLASQRSTSIQQMISVISKALSETSCEDWVGRVSWISDWL